MSLTDMLIDYLRVIADCAYLRDAKYGVRQCGRTNRLPSLGRNCSVRGKSSPLYIVLFDGIFTSNDGKLRVMSIQKRSIRGFIPWTRSSGSS